MKKDFDSKLTEFINNNTWVIPVWFVLSIILIGIVEGL
jgi:hypothetical protein